MGRAIVRQPQAFLMDEPLSNLDAKLRVQMRAEVSKIQHSLNVTTVYVTHDQIEAMTMGDRVAVLSRGVLQQVDTPQDLYDHPDNLFVGAFIGSPQMNLLEATVSTQRRRHDADDREQHAHRAGVGAGAAPVARRLRREGGSRSGSVPSTCRSRPTAPPTPSTASSKSERASVRRSSST